MRLIHHACISSCHIEGAGPVLRGMGLLRVLHGLTWVSLTWLPRGCPGDMPVWCPGGILYGVQAEMHLSSCHGVQAEMGSRRGTVPEDKLCVICQENEKEVGLMPCPMAPRYHGVCATSGNVVHALLDSPSPCPVRLPVPCWIFRTCPPPPPFTSPHPCFQ